MINHLFRFASQSSGIACAAMVVAVMALPGHGSLVNAKAVPVGSNAAMAQPGTFLGFHQVDFLPGNWRPHPSTRT